eukprot:scaffold40875_cov62-Phaeocystis_antarctica.AAC.1
MGRGGGLWRGCLAGGGFGGGGATRFAAAGEAAGGSVRASARATARAASSALEPFCRCLRHRLVRRERRSLGFDHHRLRLGRPRKSQGRLLCGGEGAEAHPLTGAPHSCKERLGQSLTAINVVHAAVSRDAIGRLQRQPLGLRLAHGRLGCFCPIRRFSCVRRRLPKLLLAVLLLFQRGGVASRPATPA